MAKEKPCVSVIYLEECGECEVEVMGNVGPYHRGGRNEPDDGPEIEIFSVKIVDCYDLEGEAAKPFIGKVLDLDSLPDGLIEGIEQDLLKQAIEQDEDAYERHLGI